MHARVPTAAVQPGRIDELVSLSRDSVLPAARQQQGPRKGDEPMVTPRCPCEQGKELWGEMWWAGRQSRWVFFDGRKNGVIWCAPMMYCLDCGYRHERDGLRSVTTPAMPP